LICFTGTPIKGFFTAETAKQRQRISAAQVVVGIAGLQFLFVYFGLPTPRLPQTLP
jgi:hypothetical protein